MRHLYRLLSYTTLPLTLFILSYSSSAQPKYTDLHHFVCATEGCVPGFPSILAQGRDGNLYGTMPTGGRYSYGTFFQATPDGKVTVKYTFDGTQGRNSLSGVTLGLDGLFYGTTEYGGLGPSSMGEGTIFKISSEGLITTMYKFSGGGGTSCPTPPNPKPDGDNPWGPPIQAKDGAFYGTSSAGTAYKITAAGKFTPLCNPTPPVTLVPYWSHSPVVQAADGNLYGTNIYINGTIFRFTPAGTITIVRTFMATDGAGPEAPLTLGSDGYLYGTTVGGNPQAGEIFRMSTNGKIFRIIHAFDRNANLAGGYRPNAGVIETTDGYLYGSTEYGGGKCNNAFGCGLLFKLDKLGNSFTVLHTFVGNVPGSPQSTQIQHTNGKIYGLLNGPNYWDGGAIYSLDVGLKPFVKLMTTSGKPGQVVQILGQGFNNVSSVKFGGGSATYPTPPSDTYMTAIVPPTGTTGFVTVTTAIGTFVSDKLYKVNPVLSSFTPVSGTTGTVVTVTGSALLGTKSVTFGGVKATVYTVNSATKITATVPAGAKTGKIAVTTAGGSAASAATFTVN